MGGLDARHMIVDREGMTEKEWQRRNGREGRISYNDRYAPFRHIFRRYRDYVWGRFVIDSLRYILDLKGFDDLTIKACDDFNRRAEAQEADNDVVYRTYASSEERDHVFLPLQPSWFIINKKEGENDGLVSIKSQHWKNELIGTNGHRKKVKQLQFPVPADHLNQIGWWDTQEDDSVKMAEYEGKIKDIYLQIARQVVTA